MATTTYRVDGIAGRWRQNADGTYTITTVDQCEWLNIDKERLDFLLTFLADMGYKITEAGK